MSTKSLFIVKDFFSFLKNPTNKRELEKNILTNIKSLVILVLLGIGVVIVLGFVTEFLFKLGVIELRENLLIYIFGPMPVWKKFLLGSILVPIVEELGFRLHLRPGVFSISLFLSFLFLDVISILGIHGVYFFIIAFLFFLIISFSLRRFSIGKILVNYWQNNFRFIFYLTAFVFGLVHVFNFSISLNVIAFAPIITIPQFLLGLELGYLRLKAGIIWSMMLHSIINSVFLVLIPFLITTITTTVIKNNDREVLEIKVSNEWNKIEFAKIDPNSTEFQFRPYRMLGVGRFDCLYQFKNSKNFPEYPFFTLENNYYFPNGYEKTKKEYTTLGSFRINDQIKDWFEFVFNLPNGKQVYDSLNQRVYWRLSRDIKDLGDVVYLKTMFLLNGCTATITCIFPKNDFKKCKNQFSQILSSVNIIPSTVYLAKENISNFKPVDFHNQFFTWREAIGFSIWILVLIVFVRIKNYNKKTDLQNT